MTTADLTALLRHSDWMRRLARDLVRDPHLADDLVQEAWAAAARRPPAPAAARSWLRRVITNAARQHHRREAGRSVELEAEPVESGRSADELVERAEMLHGVSAKVLALDEPYRSTLIRRYFEGWMPERIAREEGVPVSTVKTRLQRGLARLREELDAEHGDRRAWALVLAPFAGLPNGEGVAPVAGADAAASATPGTASAKPLALALAGGAVLVGAITVATRTPSTPASLTQPAPPAVADGSDLERAPAVEARERAEVAGSAGSTAVADRGDPSPSTEGALIGWGGVVRDAEGSPIAAAAVRLVGRDGLVLRETRSDTEGRYSLTLGAAAPLSLELDFELDFEFALEQLIVKGTALEVDAGEAYALSRRTLFERPEIVEELDHVVLDASRLDVRVVDSRTGAPLAGIPLEARSTGSPERLPLRADWFARASTGPDGAARLRIGGRDAVLLTAKSTATHFASSASFVADPSVPFELRLDRTPGVVDIELVDALTDEIVPEARLFDVESGERIGEGSGPLEGRLAERVLANSTVAAAPGYLPSRVRIEGTDAKLQVHLVPARDVTFEVRRAGELAGDAGGPAPTHIEWRLHESPPLAPERAAVEGSRSTLPIGFGGGDESTYLCDVEQLTVVLDDGTRVDFAESVHGFDVSGGVVLDLAPKTSPLLLRFVTGNGQPLPGMVVNIESTQAFEAGGTPLAPVADWRGTTDEDGRLALELPATQRHFWVRWVDDLQRVERPEGDGEVELRSPLDSARIRGALLDSAGRPARDVARLLGYLELRPLTGDGQATVFAELESDGTFEARGVLPGPYEVVTPGFRDVLVQSGERDQQVPAPEPYRWGLDLRDARTGEPALWEGRGVVRIEFGDGDRSVVTLYGDRPFSLPAMSSAPSRLVVDVPGFEPLTWDADAEAQGSRERRLTLLLYPE